MIAALVVLEEQQVRQRRREMTLWMKPWLLRQVALGHFDTVMRESRGDFKSYLRSEPPIFREMVNRLTLRISKHQDCRHLPASARKPHWLRTISIEILRRLRGDCTEIARFPYNPRAASVWICPDQSPQSRYKNRTILVYNVYTYAVARSHLRSPKNRTENRRRIYRTAPVANVNQALVIR